MSFCFAFRTTDPSLLAPALEPFSSILRLEDGAPHGWGLGYYQTGQPLLRKQPKALAKALDFRERVRTLRASLVVGHRRGRPMGPRSTENTHPFRFRNWVFCHCGTIEHFDEISADLSSAIPDFIRRNIRGATDSEVLFHLFLSFLNDTGKLDDPRLPGAIAGQALSSTLAYVDRLARECGGEPSDHCCVATNGDIIIATHRGMPLGLTRHSSYVNVGRDPEGKPISYPHLRAVFLAGGVVVTQPGWETVDENTIVTIDAGLNIEYLAPSTEDR